MALVTALYAVILAVASVGGNNAMEDILLSQPQSSDQWAFYQAKVIREHLYRAGKMEARRQEHDRDVAKTRDVYFDYGEVFLQIAIVMSSVSILSTSRPMFWFSLLLATVGTLSAADGFTLLVRIPFLH